MVLLKDGEKKVLTTQPYDQFWSKVTAIPGPYTNIQAIYCSMDLERYLRKKWSDAGLGPDSDQRVPLKGLGDLSLEAAAAMHAQLDKGLDVPHGATIHPTNGPAGQVGGDPFC